MDPLNAIAEYFVEIIDLIIENENSWTWCSHGYHPPTFPEGIINHVDGKSLGVVMDITHQRSLKA